MSCQGSADGGRQTGVGAQLSVRHGREAVESYETGAIIGLPAASAWLPVAFPSKPSTPGAPITLTPGT